MPSFLPAKKNIRTTLSIQNRHTWVAFCGGVERGEDDTAEALAVPGWLPLRRSFLDGCFVFVYSGAGMVPGGLLSRREGCERRSRRRRYLLPAQSRSRNRFLDVTRPCTVFVGEGSEAQRR